MGDPPDSGSDWRQQQRYKVQRRHRRFQVRDVRGRFPLHFEVEVLNMSLTGLAAESRRPLEIGREYEFSLVTDDEGVHLRAKVEWCHLVRTESAGNDFAPVFHSGLDFRSALDDKALEILAFLQHHIVIEAERRIFGRFRVTLEGPAKVTEHHDFVVQVISFSGMLIETDLLLDVGATLDMELRAGRREFRLAGRVANSHLATEAAEEGVCRAGIAFEGLNSEAACALEQVTKDFLE